MTEGIIQKAFNHRIEALKRNPKLQWDSYNEYASVANLLSIIEQELIEEVKQAQSPCYTIGTDYPIIAVLIEKLIGDNQE